MADDQDLNPGDDAPEGSAGTGDDTCPKCEGAGSIDGAVCPNCNGAGVVVQGVGGG